MVICLERGADLHMAQLMPLPLTVSCFSKIEIGFTFLVLAHLGTPGKRAVKWACVVGGDRRAGVGRTFSYVREFVCLAISLSVYMYTLWQNKGTNFLLCASF